VCCFVSRWSGLDDLGCRAEPWRGGGGCVSSVAGLGYSRLWHRGAGCFVCACRRRTRPSLSPSTGEARVARCGRCVCVCVPPAPGARVPSSSSSSQQRIAVLPSWFSPMQSKRLTNRWFYIESALRAMSKDSRVPSFV